MRTLILIGFFACLYLHFQKQDAVVEQLDVLSTKQAALKKLPVEKVELPAITHIQTPTQNNDNDSVQMITEADVSEEFSEDDLSQLPWDDIEEGWKTHLKDYLVSVEPEKAEEMFSAYMEEKKKYVERVDFTDAEAGVTEDATASRSPDSSSDPLVEHDGKEGDIERSHQDNLKEIFGDHYSQIESLHKEYVESVQYLNRSSVKFSISL